MQVRFGSAYHLTRPVAKALDEKDFTSGDRARYAGMLTNELLCPNAFRRNGDDPDTVEWITVPLPNDEYLMLTDSGWPTPKSHQAVMSTTMDRISRLIGNYFDTTSIGPTQEEKAAEIRRFLPDIDLEAMGGEKPRMLGFGTDAMRVAGQDFLNMLKAQDAVKVLDRP